MQETCLKCDNQFELNKENAAELLQSMTRNNLRKLEIPLRKFNKDEDYFHLCPSCDKQAVKDKQRGGLVKIKL